MKISIVDSFRCPITAYENGTFYSGLDGETPRKSSEPDTSQTQMTKTPQTVGANPEFSVELFVRSLAPQGAHGRQQALIERLERLQQDGHIKSMNCTVWGDQICPETAQRVTDGRKALQAINRLQEWAAKHNVSLRPFFEERVVRSMCEESYTVIVPPVSCLAISRGEDLWAVFPCLKDDQPLSAMEGLDILDGSTTPELFTDLPAVQS